MTEFELVFEVREGWVSSVIGMETEEEHMVCWV